MKVVRPVVVELEKLRTVRSTWLLFVAGVLLPLPFSILILLETRGLALAPEDILGLVALPAALGACLAVLACAREFEHRTIALAFTTEPRRERVIAAKATAAAIVSCAMALLALAVSLGLAAVWLSASSTPWPWTPGETVQGIFGALVFAALAAVAGTGFGAVTRHVGGAITALFCVFVVIEGMLISIVSFWHDHGPTAAIAVLVEPGRAHTYSFPVALALVVALAGAYLAAGIAVVRRIDV